MTLRALTVQCPACGSGDVTYTCEPTCCFNHICGACYCTFELLTEISGDARRPSASLPPERDSLAPTVACARCQALDVFMLDPPESPDSSDGPLLCAACGARLKLSFASVETR
jgi:hypothetical protein